MPSCSHFVVDIRESASPAVHVKTLLGYPPTGLAHLSQALRVFQQIDHGVAYSGNLARRNKHPRNAITNHLAHTAHIRGDHRPSASRSLDQGCW
jgi:hypothetical protein